uniref:Uncharacterized protein n=1 Tax=Clandestinovirus TaxID=2831644 RepID=A0A8F8PK79_9VIRU|nr:hypothetical protein KOM_12_475 [Clandestinovirus]
MPITAEPSANEIKSQSHFLIYGPASFTCGFTMDAVQLIDDKKLRIIFVKTDDLEHMKLPALGKIMEPMESVKKGDSSMVVIPDNISDVDAANKMTASWPQIFLWVPSDRKYHYIGGMGDINNSGSQSSWLAKYDSA